jgi:beta-glucosidase
VVAFPALTCLAATWSTDMALLYGRSIGEEARYRKKDVLLGPGVNIYRTPLGGRNFEYMGEDPYLAGKLAAQYVRGVQSNGVATCVKHFCLNNQEWNRHGVSVHVDDRALYELYLPAFKMACLEGGSWALMASYNKIDGQHAGHNRRTLVDILKGEWGWPGAVISDWGGTHNTDEAVSNGLDLEFGTGTNGLYGGSKNSYDAYHLAMPFLDGIRSGRYTQEQLDEKVRRVLRLHMHTTLNRWKPFGSILSPEHYAAARQIGEEGIVLLKNEGNLLPLKVDAGTRILVVGENAVKMMTVGGGSSSLKVQREVTPMQGLLQRLGGSVGALAWDRGYVGDVSGSYNGVVTGQDLRESRPFSQLVSQAVSDARQSDYIIYIGGLNKSYGQDSEGGDRKSYSLPYRQDSLIAELAKVNPNLIVVNISGNAVAMPWAKDVRAIVQCWYLGSEAGTALASVLTGDVNPSGKLPFTWPVALEDVPAHRLNAYTDHDEEYKESIFVGYRGEGSKPLFPFGHGLSYTTFAYSSLRLDKKVITQSDSLTVSVDVTNTGTAAGKEVVQLYISDLESSLPRPLKELKGFRKVTLAPGQTKTVSFTVGSDALSYFDPAIHSWVAEPGRFRAVVGSSSHDVRATAGFRLR